jgi:hypothetical protein
MTEERKAKLREFLREATDDDLAWARRETDRKSRGGFSKIADAEEETARDYLLLIGEEERRRGL